MTAHGVRGHFSVRSPQLRTASSDISAADKSEADMSAVNIRAANRIKAVALSQCAWYTCLVHMGSILLVRAGLPLSCCYQQWKTSSSQHAS